MARPRKQFPLRISPDLYAVYEAWAADEFRSVNAQIEAVLVDAARREGRLRRRSTRGGPSRPAEHD
ncbi:MAG TPA: DNA-binding protein [Euzebyales bacterium]|nr:DNA-binding protein [Euzebyales bacterium]